MDTIANNIANMNTPGFRGDGVKFETVLSEAGGNNVAYSSSGETFISRKSGSTAYTGNTLDLAIGGEGWFALDTPDGMVYTRDGRFHMDSEGAIKSVRGYSLLDPGGGPISVDPSAGPVVIGPDGGISQNGKRIGGVGVFLIPDKATLTHYDNSAVRSNVPADAAEDLTANTVRQGYLEGSNVDPILEMTRLIAASRAFDNATTAIQQSDTKTEESIRALSPTG